MRELPQADVGLRYPGNAEAPWVWIVPRGLQRHPHGVAASCSGSLLGRGGPERDVAVLTLHRWLAGTPEKRRNLPLVQSVQGEAPNDTPSRVRDPTYTTPLR